MKWWKEKCYLLSWGNSFWNHSNFLNSVVFYYNVNLYPWEIVFWHRFIRWLFFVILFFFFIKKRSVWPDSSVHFNKVGLWAMEAIRQWMVWKILLFKGVISRHNWKKNTTKPQNWRKLWRKSTALPSFVSVLEQSGPLRVPDKIDCTATVSPVLQRWSTMESQILVTRRRIYSHKVVVVLLAVPEGWHYNIWVEWSWEQNVQRLQYT